MFPSPYRLGCKKIVTNLVMSFQKFLQDHDTGEKLSNFSTSEDKNVVNN